MIALIRPNWLAAGNSNGGALDFRNHETKKSQVRNGFSIQTGGVSSESLTSRTFIRLDGH